MATTLFQGTPVALAGEFIQKGVQAPDFSLVKGDLNTFSLADAKGKFVVLNIFPSMDTGVCAASVRKFNKLAAGMENTLVLAISKDLPFAQGRFARQKESNTLFLCLTSAILLLSEKTTEC